MRTYSELYCKIFIDTDISREDLIALINKRVSGNVDRFNIISKFFDIYISKNDDFNEVKRHNESDSFLYSRYYLDVEPIDGVEQEAYINNIAELLKYLWGLNINSIASCDFEEELPRKGGYNFNSR